ncbi:MAG: hypothetical protein OZSIB_3734 [Candidatus Ozemobacter sibiricus]|uniref:Uncharacterized protein n=1 Tax=Candidatus Ozemobacter sibiricus TaxID=2268124 RepID=A0A367ZEQ5_9BACT|nr:MAG: hypothetical protein OZSIB_3734 [Candidatus Ozemobacter sibiricus]
MQDVDRLPIGAHRRGPIGDPPSHIPKRTGSCRIHSTVSFPWRSDGAAFGGPLQQQSEPMAMPVSHAAPSRPADSKRVRRGEPQQPIGPL